MFVSAVCLKSLKLCLRISYIQSTANTLKQEQKIQKKNALKLEVQWTNGSSLETGIRENESIGSGRRSSGRSSDNNKKSNRKNTVKLRFAIYISLLLVVIYFDFYEPIICYVHFLNGKELFLAWRPSVNEFYLNEHSVFSIEHCIEWRCCSMWRWWWIYCLWCGIVRGGHERTGEIHISEAEIEQLDAIATGSRRINHTQLNFKRAKEKNERKQIFSVTGKQAFNWYFTHLTERFVVCMVRMSNIRY